MVVVRAEFDEVVFEKKLHEVRSFDVEEAGIWGRGWWFCCLEERFGLELNFGNFGLLWVELRLFGGRGDDLVAILV